MLGSTAMLVRLLRVHKNLQPQRWSPSTTAFIPQFRSYFFRGQVPRSLYLFSGLPLLFRSTWLVPRAPISFNIVCRDVLQVVHCYHISPCFNVFR